VSGSVVGLAEPAEDLGVQLFAECDADIIALRNLR
jgi:hypothetical protein